MIEILKNPEKHFIGRHSFLDRHKLTHIKIAVLDLCADVRDSILDTQNVDYVGFKFETTRDISNVVCIILNYCTRKKDVRAR
jgi:hypothetical protein